MFIVRFPVLANIISFEAFALLVDKALEKFNELLVSNKKVEEYVYTTPPTVAILKEENSEEKGE